MLAIETNEQPPYTGTTNSEAKPSIKIGDDGYPVLPDFSGELESIPPQLLRDLLRDFISATWGALSLISKCVIQVVELLSSLTRSCCS